MLSRSLLRSGALALQAILMSACAQGSLGVSPGTVMSAVVLAGEAIEAATRSGSSTSSSRTGGSGTSSARRIPASPRPTASAGRVLTSADEHIGVKYTWGGNTPKSGFDCSGFTKFVFAKEGIAIPRTSREQARVGRAVPLVFEEMLPGDMLFFAEPGEPVSHVAIYVGGGEIIHSSSAMGGVNYLDLNTSRGDWYVQNLVAVRRVM